MYGQFVFQYLRELLWGCVAGAGDLGASYSVLCLAAAAEIRQLGREFSTLPAALGVFCQRNAAKNRPDFSAFVALFTDIVEVSSTLNPLLKEENASAQSCPPLQRGRTDYAPGWNIKYLGTIAMVK